MDNVIKIGALFDGYSTRADKSLKLVFTLQEIDPEMAANMLRLHQQFGWLIFAPESAKEVVIPDEPPRNNQVKKSDSQRQRSLYFVWWKKLGEPYGDFEEWKRRKMEEVNNVIRQGIAELED